MPDRLTRLSYGLGAVPFGAKAQLFGLLLLFYNQLLGLPAASVSATVLHGWARKRGDANFAWVYAIRT